MNAKQAEIIFSKGFLIISIIFILLNVPVFSQSTHSTLKNKKLLETFNSISNKILCTCGCNLPLHYCNHVGHCNGWPMREVIDELLKEGKSEKYIIDGFINGFPAKMVDTHEAFSLARSPQYAYMVERFKKGFSQALFSEPQTHSPIVLAALTGLLFLGTFLIFIKKRMKRKNKLETEKLNKTARDNDMHRVDSAQEQEILRRLSR